MSKQGNFGRKFAGHEISHAGGAVNANRPPSGSPGPDVTLDGVPCDAFQQPEDETTDPTPETPSPEPPLHRDVDDFRKCPICYQGRGGVGTAYHTRDPIRYYRCDRCNHTWKAHVTTEVISVEHQKVEITSQDVDLNTR